jgi:putative ABC transport system permease protein
MLSDQIFTVTAANLRSLSTRWQSSLVLVVAVAGVTAVILGLLGLLDSLATTVEGTSRSDRVLVLSSAAQSEVGSNMPLDVAAVAESAPGIKAASTPLVVKEVVMSVTVPQLPDGELGEVTLRGTSTHVLLVRPEVNIVKGRLFESGKKEVVLGRSIQSVLQGHADVGDVLIFRNEPWSVVGIFASGGDLHESEVWADAPTVQSTFRRTNYQSVTALLTSHEDFGAFRDYFDNQPTLNVRAVMEPDYFKSQASRLNALLGGVATAAATIMGIGAVLATVSAMMAALTARYREIGILWSLGFGSGPVIVSMIIETLLLSLLGSLIGAGLTLVLFGGGKDISTVIGSASKIVFHLAVSPWQVLTSILVACGLALAGCLPPAIRARRLSAHDLMRSL